MIHAHRMQRATPRWAELAGQWRDRLLSSPGFRQWATDFPLFRPIARRRARALFDLCAGFVYAQVLSACVQLHLFEILAEGPQNVAALARRLGLPEASAERLLDAAVALRLVARRGQRFGLGPLGAAMVGNPGITAMVEHHSVLYSDLADPVALLRDGSATSGLSKYWAYATAARPDQLHPDQVSPYTKLMAASQSMIAEEVLRAYPLAKHRKLLDVGGGDGSFIAAALSRNPKLTARLVDLPAVAAQATARFAASGLSSRATAIGGSFLKDPLPAGADVATLMRVVHDHDDDQALDVLRAVHRALQPGGTLLLAEPMAETPGAVSSGDGYFGMYLFAMGSGRPRRPALLRSMLADAGFVTSRLIPTRLPLLTRLLVAQKSAP